MFNLEIVGQAKSHTLEILQEYIQFDMFDHFLWFLNYFAQDALNGTLLERIVLWKDGRTKKFLIVLLMDSPQVTVGE